MAHFIQEIFILFSADKDTMQWSQFVHFARKAPRVVDWLTELGLDLRERFKALEYAQDGQNTTGAFPYNR